MWSSKPICTTTTHPACHHPLCDHLVFDNAVCDYPNLYVKPWLILSVIILVVDSLTQHPTAHDNVTDYSTRGTMQHNCIQAITSAHSCNHLYFMTTDESLTGVRSRTYDDNINTRNNLHTNPIYIFLACSSTDTSMNIFTTLHVTLRMYMAIIFSCKTVCLAVPEALSFSHYQSASRYKLT